jgi:hypothetical protein
MEVLILRSVELLSVLMPELFQGHDAKTFPSLRINRAIPGEVECSLIIEDFNRTF